MSGILRLVAGGLLALICCYIGLLVKRRYREREGVYGDALAYALALKSELCAKKTPIPTVAATFCKGRSGEFAKALEGFIAKSSAGEAGDLQIKCLKPAENKELASYVGGFGGYTLDEQLALAARLENFAAEKFKSCQTETKRLGNMYFRLLVLLGLAIILVLA